MPTDARPRVTTAPAGSGIIRIGNFDGTRTLTVNLSAAAAENVLVPVTTGSASDTATRNVDCEIATSVRIPAGSLTASFNVRIVADGDGNDKIFTVTLYAHLG